MARCLSQSSSTRGRGVDRHRSAPESCDLVQPLKRWRGADRCDRRARQGPRERACACAGTETLDVLLADDVKPLSDAPMVIHGIDGATRTVSVTLRIDTPIEVDHNKNGSVLLFVLQLLAVRARRLHSVAILGFATEPPLAHRHRWNVLI